MALPLITADQIIQELRSRRTGFEIFDEYPSDLETVRHGIYVDSPITRDRQPYQLAVSSGGSIYTVTDQVEILVISFQGDVNLRSAEQAVQDLVHSAILDGYHERDFYMDTGNLNRAEYRTYVFGFKRIEID